MGEKHVIEYKRQWDDEWLKWICGFANADGGTIYNGPDSLLRVFDDRITLWNQGSLPAEITPEAIYRPHDSHPRNRLIANAFYMVGFVEARGRGYELITEFQRL